MTKYHLAHNASSFQEYNHQLRISGLFSVLAKARDRKIQELLVDPWYFKENEGGFDGSGFFEEETHYGCK